jgi:phage tail sheath protein FI
MAYKHGIYVSEVPSSVRAAVKSDAGIQAIIGTAPVNLLKDPYHAANIPMLFYTMAEAQNAIGYSTDFKAYTICGSLSASFEIANVSPVIVINVLDPNKAEHTDDVPENVVQVNDGTARLDTIGLLLDKLVVKADDVTLESGTDYTAAFNDDGTVTLVVLPDGKGAGKTQLTVSGKRIAPEKVKGKDVIGGVSVDGKETGMEVLRQVFPKLGVVPGSLVAPWFSKDPTCAAIMQAKTSMLNGIWRLFCWVDLDSSSTGAQKYTDVLTQKTAQALTSPNCAAVWGCPKVGEVLYSPSSFAAAYIARQDAENDGIPTPPMSNIAVSATAICTEDGEEIYLDLDQANYVNSVGIVTFLNFNGFRLWGNNTVAYPSNTDPKDRYISARRFMSYDDNNFILTNFGNVDMRANPRLREAVIEQQNTIGASYVSSQICARYEMAYGCCAENRAGNTGHRRTFLCGRKESRRRWGEAVWKSQRIWRIDDRQYQRFSRESGTYPVTSRLWMGAECKKHSYKCKGGDVARNQQFRQPFEGSGCRPRLGVWKGRLKCRRHCQGRSFAVSCYGQGVPWDARFYCPGHSCHQHDYCASKPVGRQPR